MANHFYIFLTILFTVYGQLIIKWQVRGAGIFPEALGQKIEFLARLLLNPWVITGFAAAFLASMAWMAAMTKFPLSYAYPFMSFAFVLVLALSAVLFNEPISLAKFIGMALIVAGIIIGSQE